MELKKDFKKKFMDIFCGNFLFLLKEKNINQTFFAQRYGCSSQLINEYLNGKRCPSIYILVQMCDAIEIDVCELIKKTINDFNDVKKPMLELADKMQANEYITHARLKRFRNR